MNDVIPLFELNPDLDRPALATAFARDRRLQIRNFLTDRAARTIHSILSHETPWGLGWQAGKDGPHGLRQQHIKALGPQRTQDIMRKIGTAMSGQDYAFMYARYELLTAHLEKWGDHEALELLIEHINDEPLLELVRQVTGFADLRKADAQATLYAPNHFLALHNDSHVAEGWRVAYVMNFCGDGWRPDWGGYLNFYDDEGDVIAGYRPRFNALNLFAVPQLHNVTYVPPFAPVGRYAITGWFRDQ